MSCFPAFRLDVSINVDNGSIANNQTVSATQSRCSFGDAIGFPFIVLIAKCNIVPFGKCYKVLESFDVAQIKGRFIVSNLMVA